MFSQNTKKLLNFIPYNALRPAITKLQVLQELTFKIKSSNTHRHKHKHTHTHTHNCGTYEGGKLIPRIVSLVVWWSRNRYDMIGG